LKEHVNTNHYFIVKKFEEELSSPFKGNVGEKSRKKKGLMWLKLQSQMFLLQNIPLRKMCSKSFLKDLGL
jgi:hypothetical protein